MTYFKIPLYYSSNATEFKVSLTIKIMENQIVHISWAKIDFKCPYCERQYEDTNDKYYKRIENNNLGYTKTKCECGEKFGITIDITSQYVGFKLN